MKRPADGSREAELVSTHPTRLYIHQIGKDGVALVTTIAGIRQGEIARLRLERDATPEMLVSTPFDEFAASLSPDGRWIAYQSNESGRMEVYVRSASGEGGRWQLSTRGGDEPHWAPDTRTLYYRAEGQLFAIPIEAAETFQFGTARPLLSGMYVVRNESGITYAVDPSSKRFLTLKLAAESVSVTTLRVVLNWFRDLRSAVGE